MPLYALLGKFTQKRMETIEELPTNIDEGMEEFKKFGIELKQMLFTIGQYDVVLVVEASDDETMSRAILSWGRRGFLKTETLRGFTPEQMIELVKQI